MLAELEELGYLDQTAIQSFEADSLETLQGPRPGRQTLRPLRPVAAQPEQPAG